MTAPRLAQALHAAALMKLRRVAAGAAARQHNEAFAWHAKAV
jgi:hypothetical protein